MLEANFSHHMSKTSCRPVHLLDQQSKSHGEFMLHKAREQASLRERSLPFPCKFRVHPLELLKSSQIQDRSLFDSHHSEFFFLNSICSFFSNDVIIQDDIKISISKQIEESAGDLASLRKEQVNAALEHDMSK